MADDIADTEKDEDRWTIRGVPTAYRVKATEAARRSRTKVGPWLCQAVDAALNAEREPMDLSGPPVESARSAESADIILARTVSAIAAAVQLAGAPEVPTAFRRRANRLLRESLPSGPAKAPKPKLLAAPDE